MKFETLMKKAVKHPSKKGFLDLDASREKLGKWCFVEDTPKGRLYGEEVFGRMANRNIFSKTTERLFGGKEVVKMD